VSSYYYTAHLADAAAAQLQQTSRADAYCMRPHTTTYQLLYSIYVSSCYYTAHLADAAAAQLQQTSRAEADDTSAVSTESSYVQQQQRLAAADMQQANNIVSSTSVVEERIAGASIFFFVFFYGLAAEPSLRPTCGRRTASSALPLWLRSA
jgi:hypothetical protein